MTREIKFRGKVKHHDPMTNPETGWVEGYYFQDLTQGEMRHYIFNCPCSWEVLPETVGQFTGLLDKNGKEIYEGDILRGDEYPYNCDGVDNYFVEIVWADNVCGFYRIIHKNSNSTVRGISHGNWNELDEEDIKSFEVIGNIHDNPELLKTETL